MKNPTPCILLAAIALVALVACHRTPKETPLEREKREMKAFEQNSSLLVPYRGVKIAVRVDYTDTTGNNKRISATGLRTFAFISSLLLSDSARKEVDLMQAYRTYQELQSLKKEINAIEEDSLPTVLDKIAIAEKALSGKASVTNGFRESAFGTYNNSVEHFLLGSIWFITHAAPKDMYTYESIRINSKEISKPDQHILSLLLKSAACLEHQWYYTSEALDSDYLAYLDANKPAVIESTYYLDSVPGSSGEERFHELRAMGFAFRGYARDKSGRGTEADADYMAFADELDQAGVTSKELSLYASYLCIRNNKNDKAERFLQKVEKAPDYNSTDKQLVADLRGFMKNKNGKEFNKYIDQFSLGRIAFAYIYRVAVDSKMAKDLRSKEAGKSLMELPQKVNEAGETASGAMNADSLGKKAESILKNIFNNDDADFSAKGPDWFVDDEKVLNELDEFEQLNFKKYETLFEMVALYFDAKAHNFKTINSFSIEEFKQKLEATIVSFRKEYSID